MDKVKIGLIGTGNIAPAYIKGSRDYPILDLVACADIDATRAGEFAAEHGLQAMTVDALLADESIDIVVNLTIPRAHYDVDMAIIQAGKHCYSEKPLAVDRASGEKIVKAAKDAGVLLGCAPDTFMGGGIQTCRKLIDDGWIGDPVAAVAFMAGHGHESWHPNPSFYYDIGGGPMLDMGPYYLTALVNLLGPIKRVSASTRRTFEERIATSETRMGEVIPVKVDTHLTGVVDFASGAVGTVMMSFDIWAHHLPRIEIYGSAGTLIVPDPNTFRGPVQLWTPQDREWREIPLTHTDEIGRGSGVADMAYALRSGRPHRVNGDLAYHVLEVMEAFTVASNADAPQQIKSTVERPAMIPLGYPKGTLDE